MTDRETKAIEAAELLKQYCMNTDHIDAICALAIATVLIGVGLVAVLHIGLWMLEVI